MEVKVIYKEVKRHTAACDACRKTKRRCTGVSPCVPCVKKGIACVFAAVTKKRGIQTQKIKSETPSPTSPPIPSSTNQIVSYDNFDPSLFQWASFQAKEHVLSTEAEMALYSTLYTSFQGCWGWEVFSPTCSKDKIFSPTTLEHKMLLCTITGYISRAIGNQLRSAMSIAEAKVLATVVRNIKTTDSAIAFLNMCELQEKIQEDVEEYAAIASDIGQHVAERSSISLIAKINTTINGKGLTGVDKHRILNKEAMSLLAKASSPHDLSLALMARCMSILLKHVDCTSDVGFYTTCIAAKISEEECLSMLGDLNTLLMIKDAFYKQNVSTLFMIHNKKAYILWKLNMLDEMQVEITTLVDYIDNEPRMCYIIDHMGFLTPMYYICHQLGRYDWALKVYNFMTSLSTVDMECLKLLPPLPSDILTLPLIENVSNDDLSLLLRTNDVVYTSTTSPEQPLQYNNYEAAPDQPQYNHHMYATQEQSTSFQNVTVYEGDTANYIPPSPNCLSFEFADDADQILLNL